MKKIIGKIITRKEAIRIARKIMTDAELEREEIRKKEAAEITYAWEVK